MCRQEGGNDCGLCEKTPDSADLVNGFDIRHQASSVCEYTRWYWSSVNTQDKNLQDEEPALSAIEGANTPTDTPAVYAAPEL